MADYAFEVPQTLRDLTEENMRQAHAAYEQLTEFMTKATSVWVGAIPPSPALMGYKELQHRAMDFAMENAESAFTFAGKISSAKNVQEILALQTQFAQSRMLAFITHTQELYRLMGETLLKAPTANF
jgi:hypothetical protein